MLDPAIAELKDRDVAGETGKGKNRRRNGENNKENNGEKETKEVSPEDLAAKEVAKDIKMWLISTSSTVDGLDSFVNPWSKCMCFFSTLDVFDSFLNPYRSACM